jgi:hypothetical protein
MNRFSALPFLAAAAPALAHPTHVADSAGHSHWLALAALAAAVGVAAFAIARAFLRRRAAVNE